MILPAAERRARRRRLADHIVAAYDAEPSLLAGALASSLAFHLSDAVVDADGAGRLYAWLERTCTAIPLDAPIADMIRAAARRASPSNGGKSGDGACLELIHAGIGQILDRHARSTEVQARFEEELDSIIAAFLVRLDDSDPLSAEHSRAVSLWCKRLAARMGLSDEQCRFAGRCGILHDVGKAYTPSAILHAPRQLTDDEWVVMRDHTLGGARMLVEVERLRMFEPAARSHHERLDGKGYPDRLDASQIPQIVRIVTVADCFNAMIGRRPYRLPLSPANALEQLDRHRDTQFDSTIVDAMIDLIEHPAGAV